MRLVGGQQRFSSGINAIYTDRRIGIGKIQIHAGRISAWSMAAAEVMANFMGGRRAGMRTMVDADRHSLPDPPQATQTTIEPATPIRRDIRDEAIVDVTGTGADLISPQGGYGLKQEPPVIRATQVPGKYHWCMDIDDYVANWEC